MGAFCTHIDDVEGLLDGAFDVKREAGINLSGYLARHDGQDFLAKFNKQAVESGVNLLVQVFALSNRQCQSVTMAPVLDVLTWSLPYATATSISLAYSGFFDAARMREGFVVASWGLYLPMVAKSPESQTTVVPVAFNCSNEDVIMCVVGV